jgi:hypothetical protein
LSDLNRPHIRTHYFTGSEREHVWHLVSNLLSLAALVKDFDAAVKLREHCETRMKFSGFNLKSRDRKAREEHGLSLRWKFIAASDGAMTIFNFYQTMNGIRKEFRNCPTLKSMVDHSKLRSATKQFEQQFPNFGAIRRAAAHKSELSATKEDYDRESYTGPDPSPMFNTAGFKNVMLNGFIRNTGEFSQTIEGKIVTYCLNSTTTEILKSITAEFFSGFDNAAEKTKGPAPGGDTPVPDKATA